MSTFPRHVVETSGRMVAVPAEAAVAVPPLAHPLEDLRRGVSRCGQPTVMRTHPRDGAPESFGVFTTPALADQFLRTFGAQLNQVKPAPVDALATWPVAEGRA